MAKWRNKIEIKDLLTDDESDQSVLSVITALIPQLKRIKTKEDNIYKLQTEQGKETTMDLSFLFDLEDIIGEFEWLKESIENNENPTEYSFDSWCDAFNGALNQLYDMGDITVTQRDFFNDEKFLWIG